MQLGLLRYALFSNAPAARGPSELPPSVLFIFFVDIAEIGGPSKCACSFLAMMLKGAAVALQVLLGKDSWQPKREIDTDRGTT